LRLWAFSAIPSIYGNKLFLNRNSAAWVNAFPQNLAFAVAAVLGSYFLLEKPLLKWRRRLRS
jgi:hypothetical protein